MWRAAGVTLSSATGRLLLHAPSRTARRTLPRFALQTLQTVAFLSSFAVKDPEARFLVLVPKARGPALLAQPLFADQAAAPFPSD